MIRVLVSGATGFIGKPLSFFLKSLGHNVHELSTKKSPSKIHWDPISKKAHLQEFEDFDLMIHLAAEPLTLFPWSKVKKKKIMESRVESIRFLSQIFQQCKNPPKTLFVASAIGFYGDRAGREVDEKSGRGEGFLSEVCGRLEGEKTLFDPIGTRVIFGRFGIVLGKDGGAVAKMLPAYRMGLGAVLGDGEQWVSWIHLNDLIQAIWYVIDQTDLDGPVNMVSPNPVRQKEFASLLASTLHRPCFLKVPKWFIRLVFQEAGSEMLLASTKVRPTSLLDANFPFEYPKINQAFEKIVNP